MITQIQKRQIVDGAIDDSKVSAGAAIATNKLADGVNFVKRDGSVVLTGNLDFNNNTGINIPTPTADNQIANRLYVDTAINSLPSLYKFRNVRVASTGNILISNPGTASFDNVNLVSGDRILIRSQSTSSQNGIYVFNTSSTPLIRATDSDAWSEFPGQSVSVNEGTLYADTRWYSPVNDGGTINVTPITYTQDPSNPLNATNFIDKEIPSGSINGSNTIFILAYIPVTGSEHLYLNGILQESGAGNDYTISSNSVTLLTAPLTGEKLRVTYRK